MVKEINEKILSFKEMALFMSRFDRCFKLYGDVTIRDVRNYLELSSKSISRSDRSKLLEFGYKEKFKDEWYIITDSGFKLNLPEPQLLTEES